METRVLARQEAEAIASRPESHFWDFKSKRIDGKKFQQTVVAMLNADGGEVAVGIENPVGVPAAPLDLWDGFAVPEETNPLVQTALQEIEPVPLVEFSYLTIAGMEKKGLVLLARIHKSENVHKTSGGIYKLRRGPQNLTIQDLEVQNLRLSKGALSFEDQLVAGYTVDELAAEPELVQFLGGYSPRLQPQEFIRKERLTKVDGTTPRPTYAGVLLFADNPQAVLPKKCAIKVTRYPAEAIQEILVNAVIHRDYNLSDDIQVLVFDNRIEIKSPGRLPGHITATNMLTERFARNPKIVRTLHRYRSPPNKDIGEGLRTAFQRMQEMRLKEPQISVAEHSVTVTLPHEPLAHPEDAVLEYLKNHPTIDNKTGRQLTGIRSENVMKDVFYRLRDRGLFKLKPAGGASSWRRTTDAEQAEHNKKSTEKKRRAPRPARK